MAKNKHRTSWYSPKAGFFGPYYFEAYHCQLSPTPATTAQVDFLERVLKLKKGMKILDLACGYGRHSVELAKRGYLITGQDLNAYLLKKAKCYAASAKVHVRYICSDMRKISYRNSFDTVISMFSSFGYLENDEEDQKVLCRVSKALSPGGLFLLDIFNRDFMLREFRASEAVEDKDGSFNITQREFDFITSRIREQRICLNRRKIVRKQIVLRCYALHELVRKCREAGLKFEAVYGGYDASSFNFRSSRIILITKKE